MDKSPLFPELQPFATHMFPVSDGHTLYIEQSGNPKGLPVVVLHGGPGSGSSEKARRRFDPKRYHVIVFDQRGSGKSTPEGELKANTTEHLIADIEAIRTDLGLEQWVVYGTSWGSTLALAYAETHPEAVLGLIIGGIFLGTKAELEWISEPTGLPHLRWQEYNAVLATLPETVVPTSLEHAILQVITGPDKALARKVAEAMSVYESSACFPEYDIASIRLMVAADEHLLSHIAIELHYFAHHCFLTPNQLLEHAHRIAHIPTIILQGGLDFVCPPAAAHVLHRALPNSELNIIISSGHIANDAMEAARIEATQAMAKRLLK